MQAEVTQALMMQLGQGQQAVGGGGTTEGRSVAGRKVRTGLPRLCLVGEFAGISIHTPYIDTAHFPNASVPMPNPPPPRLPDNPPACYFCSPVVEAWRGPQQASSQEEFIPAVWRHDEGLNHDCAHHAAHAHAQEQHQVATQQERCGACAAVRVNIRRA